MSATFLCTYADVLDSCDFFLRSRAISLGVPQEVLRGCVESAQREIVTARDWQCMKRFWRLQLRGTVNTGTVTYSESNGNYPYQVTLTGATWPSWVQDAQIRIGDSWIPCDVDQVISPTVLTLLPPRIPAADYLTATPYLLGCSWYTLPPEFIGTWAPAERNAWFIGEYVPFEQWYLMDKYRTMASIVRQWSYGPAPNRLGTMALYVYPWSANSEEYDMLLKFRPRALAVSGKDSWAYQGTVSVANGSAAVTGSSTPMSTAFRSSMVGSIMRFSSDTTKAPTSTGGTNPYAWQQTIGAVTSATQLTLTGTAPQAFTSTKYVVSDPIDLQQNLYDAFLRNCEKQLAYMTGMKDAATIERYYLATLQRAKMSDSPVNQRSVAGEVGGGPYRLWQNQGNRPWVGG